MKRFEIGSDSYLYYEDKIMIHWSVVYKPHKKLSYNKLEGE